tara:strand:+ start:929 stop:1657 length:729 start_codon:yes stop_codon:yes gene_type:complete
MEKKKYTQEDLDRILGALHQGPLGTRKEWQWDSRFKALMMSSDKKQRKIVGLKNKAHKKKLAKDGKLDYLWSKEVIKKRAATQSKQRKGVSKPFAYGKMTKETHTKAWKKSVAKRIKPVDAYTLKGKFYKRYSSLKEASDDTGACVTAISAIIRKVKNVKSAKGYTFKYSSNSTKPIPPVHTIKPIVAINEKGNETFFDSPSIAAKELTIKTGIKFYSQAISAVLNPQCIQKTSKGYTFKYA